MRLFFKKLQIITARYAQVAKSARKGNWHRAKGKEHSIKTENKKLDPTYTSDWPAKLEKFRDRRYFYSGL